MEPSGERVGEIHPENASIKDLKATVPKPAQPVSIDEMNEAIAGAATEAE
jgi:hypothetical protein